MDLILCCFVFTRWFLEPFDCIMLRMNVNNNLVPRVSHLPPPSLAPGGGKMRDPGNEVVYDPGIDNPGPSVAIAIMQAKINCKD